MLIGTRLYVYQVIATLRASDGSSEAAAEYLGITEQQVRGALEYYADFAGEVDEDAARDVRVQEAERARWQRQREALG
jgi:uncharacterized protein (DUF433 family)